MSDELEKPPVSITAEDAAEYDVSTEGMALEPLAQRFVAFVDGSFGGRRVVIEGDYQKVMSDAAASDPKLARELKRRGWIP